MMGLPLGFAQPLVLLGLLSISCASMIGPKSMNLRPDARESLDRPFERGFRLERDA